MNEVLLLLEVVLELGIVLLAFYLGREWLYGTIIANLLLICLFGSKLISVFGVTTNSGNVSYAAVLFAMFLLLEREGARSAARAIWVGLIVVLMFFSILQIIVAFGAAPDAASIPVVLDVRLVLGSLCAFAVAQFLNIGLYRYWHEYATNILWWVRALVLMALTQLVDTVLFFNIAFFGTVPSRLLFQSIFIGYLIKICFGIVSTPLIYANRSVNILPHRM